MFKNCCYSDEEVSSGKIGEFIEASARGDMQTLRSFLNNKAGGNVIKRYASRALIIAANKSQDEVAELILKNGVDVNARGPEQNATAVHYAIANGDIKMLKLLIKYGANLSIGFRKAQQFSTNLKSDKID